MLSYPFDSKGLNRRHWRRRTVLRRAAAQTPKSHQKLHTKTYRIFSAAPWPTWVIERQLKVALYTLLPRFDEQKRRVGDMLYVSNSYLLIICVDDDEQQGE